MTICIKNLLLTILTKEVFKGLSKKTWKEAGDIIFQNIFLVLWQGIKFSQLILGLVKDWYDILSEKVVTTFCFIILSLAKNNNFSDNSL